MGQFTPGEAETLRACNTVMAAAALTKLRREIEGRFGIMRTKMPESPAFGYNKGWPIPGSTRASRVAIGALADGIFLCVVGEGADHCTRGACAPRAKCQVAGMFERRPCHLYFGVELFSRKWY